MPHLPSLAIPLGLSEDGLPIGIQLIGPMWSDHKLCSMGEEIASVLGVLRTPCVLVLVDPALPGERSRTMAAESDARRVVWVGDEPLEDVRRRFGGIEDVVRVSRDAPDVADVVTITPVSPAASPAGRTWT